VGALTEPDPFHGIRCPGNLHWRLQFGFWGHGNGRDPLVARGNQEKLVGILIVLLSMRAFTRPTRPKFNYTSQEFATIQFKHSFFTTHGQFARKLDVALIQASRAAKAKKRPTSLEKMLVNADEASKVLDLLFQSDAQK